MTKSSKIDPDLVTSMLGLRVLVGLTYLDSDGNLIELKQFFGVIESISDSGVTLRNLVTDERLNLPPDLSNYRRAAPGQYRLRSTGEVIDDPDLLSYWTIEKPVKQ